MLEENGYEYVAIIFGTIYLIPQIILGHKTKNLKNVSTFSLLILIFSSILWAYYLYNSEMIYYSYATAFVTINAIVILCQKYIYYIKYLKKKIQSSETNL